MKTCSLSPLFGDKSDNGHCGAMLPVTGKEKLFLTKSVFMGNNVLAEKNVLQVAAPIHVYCSFSL
jgi:hypothetical protein